MRAIRCAAPQLKLRYFAMDYFGNLLLVRMIFFICINPALSINESASNLPSSCAVTSYFSSKSVDVHCNGQLPDFSRIDFPLVSRLYELVVRKCTFERVPKHAFQGLSNLNHLYLECIKAVPELQFEESSLHALPNLRVASIFGNIIKSLPKDIFCHVPKLEKLYMLNNSISKSEIFGFGENCSESYCRNSLSILELSANTINRLPNRTFCSLRNLMHLGLSSNGMRSIEEDALLNLGSLKTLDLAFNNLTSIPETTLKPLIGLHNLDLDGNMNLNISGFLKYVPHLKGLFLPGIGLKYIEKDAFQGLHKVESLMLYNNYLHHIDEDVFEPLIGIVDNAINESAPTECEEDAVNRLVFGGEYMLLAKQQAEVANVTGLRYLNLNDNNFTVVPPIRKLFKLFVFSISRNQIEILDDGTFNSLRKLQRLSLSFNRIRYISDRLFANLYCLKQLLLDHNAIDHINSTAFHSLIALSELHLEHNRIKDIRGFFSKNENLKLLYLSNNYLEELSLEIMPPNIVKLDVSHNSIKHLVYSPSSLPKHVQMELLDLSDNQIGVIHKNFFPTSLIDLYLHNNLIKNISNCIFCSLSMILNVTMHNNLLQSIHPEDLRIYALPVFQKTPFVSLSGNNFICNCKLEELRYFAFNQSYLQIEDLKTLPCHREYSKNKPNVIQLVQAISPEDFLCKISHQQNASLPEACSIYHDLNWKYIIGDCSGGNLTRIPTGIPSGVRKLYLDGNYFSTLQNSTFKAKVYNNLTELYLNGSHVEIIEDNTFIELISLTHLHMKNNRLKYLSNSTFTGLHRLIELSLSFNNLKIVEDWSFYPLRKINILQLNNNELRSFPVWNLAPFKSLSSISLSENPWSCDCDYVQNFREWLQSSAAAVMDINSLYCKFDDNSTSEVPLIAYNASHCHRLSEQSFLESKYFPLMTGLVTSLVVFSLACIILYLYRKEMQVLIYSRYGVRIFHKNDVQSIDGEKLYDAFICYSNSDEDFVVDQLLPNLEAIEPPFRCCIHQRDFLVGGYITDNILEAVSKSRRSILVLSEAFISSEWCRFEFKTAYVQMLKDKCNRVIVIVVGDVPKKLDPEMKLYLKTNTYLSWGDKLFWKRLYFAMPDRVQMKTEENEGL